MEIFPAPTVDLLVQPLQSTLTANVLIVISVIGLAVGIAFVTGWFNKSTQYMITESVSSDDNDDISPDADDQDLVDELEYGDPSPQRRAAIIKKLKSRGY